MKRILISAAIAVVALLAFQIPIPPTDDSNHEGQPSWCQNQDGNGYLHNCSCRSMMADGNCGAEDKGGESPRCSVYCRKHACRCVTDCGRTE